MLHATFILGDYQPRDIYTSEDSVKVSIIAHGGIHHPGSRFSTRGSTTLPAECHNVLIHPEKTCDILKAPKHDLLILAKGVERPTD